MSHKLSRRALLGRGLCCLGVAAGVDALAVEPRWLTVSRNDVPVPGLPAAFNGYRIAQLSDLHLTSLGSLHEAVCREVASYDPQLVVISGDAVEAAEALGVLSTLCDRLAAPGRDVIATAGNWEHWGHVPTEALARAYSSTGARLLGNTSTRIASGPSIVAIDDFCSGHDDVAGALSAVVPAEVTLLVTHAPGIFDRLPATTPRFALGLAGHTHGGQVCALGKPVWVPPGSGRFTEGFYETSFGPVYVSRGIGTSVLPARFTCRPELSLFRLVEGPA